MERLAIYEHHLKVKKTESTAAYSWNKALCGALFPAIQCLEITLRNAIDQAIQENPPLGAKGLYSTGSDWIFSLTTYMGNRTLKNYERYTKTVRKGQQAKDQSGYTLAKDGTRIIVKRVWEESKVVDAKKKLRSSNKQVTPAAVIASMDFGFWTNFLSYKYESANDQALLWPNQIPYVFPNAPSGTSRSDIEKKFSKVRDLRNRLTHHEAIWKFFTDDPHTGKPDYTKPVYGSNASCNLLLKHYEDILELISWMSFERLNIFLNHGSDLRFRSLCSLSGLHSYIAPNKIEQTINVNKGGWGIRKLIKKLEKGQAIRVTNKDKAVYTVSNDLLKREMTSDEAVFDNTSKDYLKTGSSNFRFTDAEHESRHNAFRTRAIQKTKKATNHVVSWNNYLAEVEEENDGILTLKLLGRYTANNGEAYKEKSGLLFHQMSMTLRDHTCNWV